MSKLEVFVAAVALVAASAGLQTAEAPVEQRLLSTTEAMLGMSPAEFEAWCRDRDAKLIGSLNAAKAGRVTCAWFEQGSGRAWHAALHFDGHSTKAVKADAGLVEASNQMLFRLVHNIHGARDARTEDGFSVWAVEVDGAPHRLMVAEFDDITVVRMARNEEPTVLSMR